MPTKKAGNGSTFLHLFSFFFRWRNPPIRKAGFWTNFLRFSAQFGSPPCSFTIMYFAMNPGDSVPQQSDDLVFAERLQHIHAGAGQQQALALMDSFGFNCIDFGAAGCGAPGFCRFDLGLDRLTFPAPGHNLLLVCHGGVGGCWPR